MANSINCIDNYLYLIDILIMLAWVINGKTYTPELLHSAVLRQPAGVRGGDYHCHPVYHLILYNAGPAFVLIEGQRLPVDKGTFIFISPMQRHQFITHKEFGYIYREITFGLYDVDQKPASIPFSGLFQALGLPVFPEVSTLDSKTHNQVSLLLDFFTKFGYNVPRVQREKEKLKADLSSFLFMLGSALEKVLMPAAVITPGSSDSAMEKVIAYLNQHYQERIRLRDVADVAACSREHLSRKFRRFAGKTLTDYVVDLRLDLAERMIKTSGLPIKDICAQVGMEDIYYFSKRFKRRFGVPPRRYRIKYEKASFLV